MCRIEIHNTKSCPGYQQFLSEFYALLATAAEEKSNDGRDCCNQAVVAIQKALDSYRSKCPSLQCTSTKAPPHNNNGATLRILGSSSQTPNQSTDFTLQQDEVMRDYNSSVILEDGTRVPPNLPPNIYSAFVGINRMPLKCPPPHPGACLNSAIKVERIDIDIQNDKEVGEDHSTGQLTNELQPPATKLCSTNYCNDGGCFVFKSEQPSEPPTPCDKTIFDAGASNHCKDRQDSVTDKHTFGPGTNDAAHARDRNKGVQSDQDSSASNSGTRDQRRNHDFGIKSHGKWHIVTDQGSSLERDESRNVQSIHNCSTDSEDCDSSINSEDQDSLTDTDNEDSDSKTNNSNNTSIGKGNVKSNNNSSSNSRGNTAQMEGGVSSGPTLSKQLKCRSKHKNSSSRSVCRIVQGRQGRSNDTERLIRLSDAEVARTMNTCFISRTLQKIESDIQSSCSQDAESKTSRRSERLRRLQEQKKSMAIQKIIARRAAARQRAEEAKRREVELHKRSQELQAQREIEIEKEAALREAEEAKRKEAERLQELQAQQHKIELEKAATLREAEEAKKKEAERLKSLEELRIQQKIELEKAAALRRAEEAKKKERERLRKLQELEAQRKMELEKAAALREAEEAKTREAERLKGLQEPQAQRKGELEKSAAPVQDEKASTHKVTDCVTILNHNESSEPSEAPRRQSNTSENSTNRRKILQSQKPGDSGLPTSQPAQMNPVQNPVPNATTGAIPVYNNIVIVNGLPPAQVSWPQSQTNVANAFAALQMFGNMVQQNSISNGLQGLEMLANSVQQNSMSTASTGLEMFANSVQHSMQQGLWPPTQNNYHQNNTLPPPFNMFPPPPVVPGCQVNFVFNGQRPFQF